MMRLHRLAIALLIGTLILLGCTQTPVKTTPESPGIFPYGTYQHNVKIEVIAPPQTMNMHGVVSYSVRSLKVVGLSAFGTTVFRIEENLVTGELKKDFFVEVIRQHESAVMDFYQLVHTLITAPKGATDFTKGRARFSLRARDGLGIYRQIDLRDPRLNLHVEVTSYDL